MTELIQPLHLAWKNGSYLKTFLSPLSSLPRVTVEELSGTLLSLCSCLLVGTMKGPLWDQTILQTPLLPFLQQIFSSQFSHIAGNLAGVCSRWHRPKLPSSHTLQFCLLGHMRCITCAMWWNSGAHRSTISIPAVCHVTWKILLLAVSVPQVSRCHLTMFT